MSAKHTLIAAAPEMHDELKRSTALLLLLLAEITGTPLERLAEPVQARIKANRAAIAKAEPAESSLPPRDVPR